VWVIKSRTMRWAGHVARMGEGRGVHRVLVGKPEGKRPLGRSKRRWEDNIKMDLQEVLLYVLFVLCRSVYCLCVSVYCTTATG
jgi:hypothetical protein